MMRFFMKATFIALTFYAGPAFSQTDIPVDLLTGRAQISIPMGGVSSGPLSVPLGLVYNSSGVRVQSVESNAGMNWTFFAGGSIRREVRGLPDDYFGGGDATDLRRGWLVNTLGSINFTSDDNLSTCADEQSDWTLLNSFGYVRDTEPDVYFFDAPGLSGQFVFGADKQPKPIPYQDIKIVVAPADLSGPILSITIIKNDGTRYIFQPSVTTTRQALGCGSKGPSQFLSTYNYYRVPLKFTSEWGLSTLSSPSGSSINFCYGNFCNEPGVYDNLEYTETSFSKVEVASTSSTATSALVCQYMIKDVVVSSYLHKITVPATVVTINYTGNLVRDVLLEDRIFGNTKAWQLVYLRARKGAELGRKFLHKVVESNSTSCNTFPAFTFEYYDVTTSGLEATTSISFQQSDKFQDLWGYFNNVGESLNPTVYYYNSRTGAERYRFYPIPGVTETAKINGANRSVNPNTVFFGSLSKINYPTGGSATIFYEPNTYFDAEANVDQNGPGLRVQKVFVEDNVAGAPRSEVYYSYRQADNKSSGKWIYRSTFGYHDVGNLYAQNKDLSPEPYIMYERVVVSRPGNGESIFEYLLPGTYPLTTSAGGWNASRVNIARDPALGCTTVGELKKQHFSHPFAPNTNFDFERGLLSKVTDKNSAGQIVGERLYTYEARTTPAYVVQGVRFERLRNVNNLAQATSSTPTSLFVFSHYSLLTNVGKVLVSETERRSDTSDPTKFFVTTTNYSFSSVHQLLSSMSVLNSDGKTTKTSYKYAKDFAGLVNPNPASERALMVKKLNDDFMHASPVETTISTISNGTETVLNSALILYGSFPDSVGGSSRVLPREALQFTGGAGFSAVTVNPATESNQDLQFSGYRPSVTFEKYDYSSNLLSSRNSQRVASSTHFGYKSSAKVAEFSNASFDEVLFAGFETYTGGEFNVLPPSLTFSDGWTGRRGASLQANNVLRRTALKKGIGRAYRYSFWLKSSAATTVNLRITSTAGVGPISSVNYTSTDINKWKFFEGRIDMSTVPAQFDFQFDVTGAAVVDDIAFYPEAAIISTSTFEPLRGVTSSSNDKGISSFVQYDDLGKVKYVFDQDKNLRKAVDYYYKVQPFPKLSSEFLSSLMPYQTVKGSTVIFTAPSNCVSPVTYSWSVDGVQQVANATSFTYLFSTVKKYTVSLVATHPVYGASTSSMEFDIKEISQGPITVHVADSVGTNSYAYCDQNHSKTFKATIGGCYVIQDVDVRWFYNIGGGWVEVASGDAGITTQNQKLNLFIDPIIIFNGINNLAGYSIKCEVSTICPLTGLPSTNSFVRVISFNGSRICQ